MKKIKKTIIGVLMGLFLLSISATAEADLSPNLIGNSGFETTTGDPIDSTIAKGALMTSGQWYSFGSNIIYWDNIKSSGGHNNSHYAQETGTGTTQLAGDYLAQSFKVSSAWPGGVASGGPVTVSLWYIRDAGSFAPSGFRLYGSNSQPTFGGYYDYGRYTDNTEHYGTLLGTYSGGYATTSSWTQVTLNLNPSVGYTWYTIDLGGGFYNSTGSYFGIDDVSVQITGSGPSAVPIPSAVWLLGAGLLGIAGIRRRVKEQRFK